MSEVVDSPDVLPVDPVHVVGGGRVEVRPGTGLVSVDGAPLEGISPKQLELLAALADSPGLTVPTSEICEAIWGEDNLSARACLGVHLMNLRRNLGEGLGDLDEGLIETVHGIGYRTREPDDTGPQVSQGAHLIADGRVAVDPESPAVWVDGRHVGSVTPAEYRIALELARRPNRIVGVPTLMRIARDDGRLSTRNSVQNHIKNLRIKLGGRFNSYGPHLGHFRYGAVRTSPGLGYFAVRNLLGN